MVSTIFLYQVGLGFHVVLCRGVPCVHGNLESQCSSSAGRTAGLQDQHTLLYSKKKLVFTI